MAGYSAQTPLMNGTPSGGGAQTIHGKNYEMYSPEWYAAQDENKVQQAGVAGTAQGTGAGNEATTFLKALQSTGLPLLGSSSGSGGGGGYGGGSGGGSGGGVTPPPIQPPSFTGLQSAASQVPEMAPLDTSGAQAAAFARSKDQIGQASQGSLVGLRSALGGRGMLGSGAEHRGVQNIAGRGLGEIGDTSRELAIQSSGLAERQGTTNYQGGIAQRGQTLGANQAKDSLSAGMAKTGYEGAIQQRGQDIAAQQEAARMRWEQVQQQQQQQQQALQGLLSALGGSGKRTY